MTKVADRLVLDTNLLLAASDTGRPEYARARAALDEWPARGTTLYTSGQILREYLAVATRAEAHNGLGLSRQDAVWASLPSANQPRTASRSKQEQHAGEAEYLPDDPAWPRNFRRRTGPAPLSGSAASRRAP